MCDWISDLLWISESYTPVAVFPAVITVPFSHCMLNVFRPDNVFSIYRTLYQGAEKATATHSSTLAWKIPWMEEPDRPQFMGSLRVGHD